MKQVPEWMQHLLKFYFNTDFNEKYTIKIFFLKYVDYVIADNRYIAVLMMWFVFLIM